MTSRESAALVRLLEGLAADMVALADASHDALERARALLAEVERERRRGPAEKLLRAVVERTRTASTLGRPS